MEVPGLRIRVRVRVRVKARVRPVAIYTEKCGRQNWWRPSWEAQRPVSPAQGGLTQASRSQRSCKTLPEIGAHARRSNAAFIPKFPSFCVHFWTN